MYKIIGEIKKGNKIIGYKLLKIEDSKYTNVSLKNAVIAAQNNLILNARYDEKNGLVIYENNKSTRTNHEAAKIYIDKAMIMGIKMDVEYLPDDRVRLISIASNKEKIIIPPFITDFKRGDGDDRSPILKSTYTTEVYVDNKPDRDIALDWLFSNCRNEDIKLKVKYPNRVISMRGLFYDCTNLRSVEISKIGSQNLRDTSKMFEKSINLEYIKGLESFNTSGVIDMHDMFAGCNNLKILDISNFNTTNVRDMSGMFCWCQSLTELNLSNFDTSRVENMAAMFTECSNILNLDVANFDTHSVENMAELFSGCESIVGLDLSNFNTSKVKDMKNMFLNCYELRELNIRSFDTRNVIDMSHMFSNCYELRELDVKSFNTLNVKDMSFMFSDCRYIGKLNLSSFDTRNVKDMSFIFSGSECLRNLDARNFRADSLEDMSFMFSDCVYLEDFYMDYFNPDLDRVDYRDAFSGCDANLACLSGAVYSVIREICTSTGGEVTGDIDEDD